MKSQWKHLYPKAKESQKEEKRKENLFNYMDMDNFINKCLIYPLHLDMVNNGE